MLVFRRCSQKAAAHLNASTCRPCGGVAASDLNAHDVSPRVPSAATPDETKVVFRCAGIDDAAVTMRRRVQVGMGLEVFGTQLGNCLHHSGWDSFVADCDAFFYENSAILLGVHVLVVWRYQAFLRDALLARHVTRISLGAAAPKDAAGAGCEKLVAVIETGPWTRRVELERAPRVDAARGDVDAAGRVELGRLFRLGVLHVDRGRGHVVDEEALSAIASGSFVVTGEEVTADADALGAAFVPRESLVPFLEESMAGGGAQFSAAVEERPWLQRVCQWPGARPMGVFGCLALAMGGGTALLWSVPGAWRHLSF